MGQYPYVIQRDHHRANTEGQVYTHILVAEAMLGRSLLPEEVVHHRDENKLNNNPDNLVVFATRSDHTRFHRVGCDESTLILQDNGSYCTSKQELRKVCQCCGAEFIVTKDRKTYCGLQCARRCNGAMPREINGVIQRCSTKPTKEKLLETINENHGNFSAVARIYQVTDNAIRRWCQSYGMDTHAHFYRQVS